MPESDDSARTSASDRFNNTIAIIVALISAFLAVASIKGDNVVQAMQRRQALLTDSWNQYQAKRLRQFELDLEVQRAGAMIRDGVLKETPENAALMEAWRKDIERYRTELKELTDAANGHQAEYERLNGADDLLDFAASFLSLALALLAVAALTRIPWLLGLAAGISLVGLAFGLAGFAGFEAIRPEWLSKLVGA
jgi:small-conductance mechanosensitive channel